MTNKWHKKREFRTDQFPFIPKTPTGLLKTINEQFNTVWMKIKGFNPHFQTRWRDYHKYTPVEVALCRNDLVEQILYECSLENIEKSRQKNFLNIYDVYTGTGSDFVSFLTMYPKMIYGNCIGTNSDILQDNLTNFEHAFKRKDPHWNNLNMSSVWMIQISKESMFHAHTRINPHEPLHLLYLDAPWKLPHTPLHEARSPPEDIMDAIINWVIDPLQRLDIHAELIVIKGKWSSEIMTKLCEKLLWYEHILTVTTAPFKNEFQFHFLQLHHDVKAKHSNGDTKHVADLHLVNSKIFDEIYSIPRANKENVLPPIDNAAPTEYQLQIQVKGQDGTMVTRTYNKHDKLNSFLYRYNV